MLLTAQYIRLPDTLPVLSTIAYNLEIHHEFHETPARGAATHHIHTSIPAKHLDQTTKTPAKAIRYASCSGHSSVESCYRRLQEYKRHTLPFVGPAKARASETGRCALFYLVSSLGVGDGQHLPADKRLPLQRYSLSSNPSCRVMLIASFEGLAWPPAFFRC
jgi:hypothetical protein